MKYLAVLDGALQCFLGGDLDGVGHGFLTWGGWRKYGYERKVRKNYAKVAEKYQSQLLKICCIAFATFAQFLRLLRSCLIGAQVVRQKTYARRLLCSRYRLR